MSSPSMLENLWKMTGTPVAAFTVFLQPAIVSVFLRLGWYNINVSWMRSHTDIDTTLREKKRDYSSFFESNEY